MKWDKVKLSSFDLTDMSYQTRIIACINTSTLFKKVLCIVTNDKIRIKLYYI